jgi:glycosyltransferase involved in cell wall biosynthesis
MQNNVFLNGPKRPLLSICVPTHNRVTLLMRTLRSVMADTADVEIIVTDNSTGNETKEAVEALFANYPHPWCYFKNNLGPLLSGPEKMVKSFNRAVQLAKGSYIFMIHDDDYLLTGAVGKLVKHLRDLNNRHAVLLFGVQLVDLHKRPLRKHIFGHAGRHSPKQAVRRLLGNSSSMRFPSFVFRRDVYQWVGDWDIDAYAPVDYDLWARAFSVYGAYVIDEALAAYTIHPHSVTMTMFQASTIEALNDIFELVRVKGLIEDRELERLKSNFMHQFILAGAWKFIRIGAYEQGKRVLDLCEHPQLHKLPLSVKWASCRFCLQAYSECMHRWLSRCR